jgi:hypothetical protein
MRAYTVHGISRQSVITVVYKSYIHIAVSLTLKNLKCPNVGIPLMTDVHSGWHKSHEGIWGSGGIVQLAVNLGAKCRSVVGFKPRPIYSENEPLLSFNRGLGGPKI